MDCEKRVCISIDQLSQRGWGIGTYTPPMPAQPGKVEVVGALPGDELSVRLSKKRRGRWRGDLPLLLKSSPLRVEPRCFHAPLCGGCTWQQMDYAAQLEMKRQRVEALFTPLLDSSFLGYEPMIACENPWRYRNKMEFSFSQNRAGEKFLGLVLAGSKGHVFNLSMCHLASEWFVRLVEQVRKWWEESALLAYRMNGVGALRTLLVREGKRTGDKLVMLTVSGDPAYALQKAQLQGFIDAVRASVAEGEQERVSVFLRIQQTCKGSATQFFEMHLGGPDHLLEKMSLALDPPMELSFKISPASFFQPNTFQAEKLYSAALRMVRFPKKLVLDLYAGIATLGMAMATKAERVIAIEINPYACFDAKSNKELNALENVEILCGDVGRELDLLRSRPDFVPPDLVVVDPPRAGLDAKALAHLKELRAKELLYISCHPESQAANVQELITAGYRVLKVQSVDQFSHTPHIENIVLLG